jgi:ketosteroid isomerase-like protein
MAINEIERVRRVATEIADAIGRKDAETLARYLAPGFVLRSPGGDVRDARAFLDGVRQIPVEIIRVALDAVDIDVSDAGALVTGIQHAQVRLEGAIADDRRAFVDWFVIHDGEWRLRVAVDLPSADEGSADAPA